MGDPVTIDVKTNDRTVHPKSNYDNTVPLYNHANQRPNYYDFLSLSRDISVANNSISRFTYAHILGGIDILFLDTNGIRWKECDVDPDNGPKFWPDCINVKMDALLSDK